MTLLVAAWVFFRAAISVASEEAKPPAGPPPDDPHVCVNVRAFSHLVQAGDWSAAIQAAIDSVSGENGFDAGGTVLFPAGTY